MVFFDNVKDNWKYDRGDVAQQAVGWAPAPFVAFVEHQHQRGERQSQGGRAPDIEIYRFSRRRRFFDIFPGHK